LKQIGLALQNYHAAYNSFPPVATYDADGRPLLSWRVLILPYLGPTENVLYQQFHLDEPWDSPNNLPLMNQMPQIFRCPFDPVYPTNTTSYAAISGEGTMFPPARAVQIGEITDGTANTAAVGELAGSNIVWSKPDDVVFDESFAGPGNFGSIHPGGWNMLMADGSVRFINSGMDTEVMRGLMTIAGGEEVDESDF
jgi:prepilin-type processing-associated H-X9-DG protein